MATEKPQVIYIGEPLPTERTSTVRPPEAPLVNELPEIEDYLQSLFSGVGDELLNVYNRTKAPDVPGHIFPRTRSGDIRVSEQEPKQCFLRKLDSDSRYRFSVETPTREAHGAGTNSGRVDATLYMNGHNIDAHVEFKQGNCEPDQIRTSLEKLVREEKLGGWFHTLEAADRGTLPSIANMLVESLDKICDYLEESEPHPCLFAFCILKSRRLYFRWLTLGSKGSFEQCEHAFRDVTLWDFYELECSAELQGCAR
jgi:hypothetical protein